MTVIKLVQNDQVRSSIGLEQLIHALHSSLRSPRLTLFSRSIPVTLSQTSDHKASGPEHFSDNTRGRATMTSPTSSSSPNSESSDPDMDELISSMGRNTFSDKTRPPGTTSVGLRMNSSGHYSCHGYCVESDKPCKRDGMEVVQCGKDIERYCSQHNPEKKHLQCNPLNKTRRRRCAIICSIGAGEVREDGRPICNKHHKEGAKLMDGSRYPPHPRLNKE